MENKREVTIAASIGLALWTIRLADQVRNNHVRRSVLEGCETQSPGRRITKSVLFWGLLGFFGFMPLAIEATQVQVLDPGNAILPWTILPYVFIGACLVMLYQTARFEAHIPRLSALVPVVGPAAFIVAFEYYVVIGLSEPSLWNSLYPETRDYIVMFSSVVGIGLGYTPLLVEMATHLGRVVSVRTRYLFAGVLGATASVYSAMRAIPGSAQRDITARQRIVYIILLILETILFLYHLVWLACTRRTRKDARRMGMTFDELAILQVRAGTPFRFAASRQRTMASSPIVPGGVRANNYTVNRNVASVRRAAAAQQAAPIELHNLLPVAAAGVRRNPGR